MPKPVNPRYQTLEEFNEAALSEHNVNRLQHKLSQFLYDTLGIRMENDGSVPSSDDYPRIFVMAPDRDGGDLPQDLNASGIRPGTREFMEQVQKGNVFAYYKWMIILIYFFTERCYTISAHGAFPTCAIISQNREKGDPTHEENRIPSAGHCPAADPVRRLLQHRQDP